MTCMEHGITNMKDFTCNIVSLCVHAHTRILERQCVKIEAAISLAACYSVIFEVYFWKGL